MHLSQNKKLFLSILIYKNIICFELSVMDIEKILYSLKKMKLNKRFIRIELQR